MVCQNDDKNLSMDTGLVSEIYKPIIPSFLAPVPDDLSMVLK